VRVIAERPVKGRAFANRTVNPFGIVRIAECEHVRFDGNQQVSRCIWELAQHGLAADDHDFGRPGDAGGGAIDVFKLRSLRGGNAVSIPGLHGR
jgi:hypothetical protein